MHLSNKGCRNYYLMRFQCRCPEGRCWYREMKDRQERGEEVKDVASWMKSVQPSGESE